MIELKDVVKRFGDLVAVRDADKCALRHRITLQFSSLLIVYADRAVTV